MEDKIACSECGRHPNCSQPQKDTDKQSECWAYYPETFKAMYQYYELDQHVLAVATRGGRMDDWAAYIGAVPGYRHDDEWQEVAGTGSKLPQNIAEAIFPYWKVLKYRR